MPYMSTITIFGFFAPRHIYGSYWKRYIGHRTACFHFLSAQLFLLTSSRLDFLSTLKGIHKAGILHGDLRRQNLLIDELGHIAIIDFDQSTKTFSIQAMESELEELADLLDGQGGME